MSQRETHTVDIAGITRHLPLFEVASGVRIAIFNILGDTEATYVAAAALLRKLGDHGCHTLITAEAKSIPLIYEMSRQSGLPYVVLRKVYKSYMGQALHAQTTSITTGKLQDLYLDEKDKPLVTGQKLILVDDVVSTGSTVEGIRKIITEAGGEVGKITAVFTEGDFDWSHVVSLGNLPIFKQEA